MAELIPENKRMKVFQKQLGEWDNLNHLLVCKSTGKGCIVDPLTGFWVEFCRQENIELVQVWLTHSHWDHVKRKYIPCQIVKSLFTKKSMKEDGMVVKPKGGRMLRGH